MAYDCTVIGGGVIGLSIAAQLSLSGKVVQVIAADGGRGEGASGTPTGILMPWDGKKKHPARLEAFDAWPTWTATIEQASGIPVEFVISKTLRLDEAVCVELDPSVTSFELDETMRSSEGIIFGAKRAFLPGAHLAPLKLLKALCAVICRAGGRIVEDRVVAVESAHFAVQQIVGARSDSYRSQSYVFAAGLGTARFFEKLGINEELIGDGGEVLCVRTLGGCPHLILYDDMMLVPKGDSQVWIAGIHRKFEKTPSFCPQDRSRLLAVAQKVFGEEIVGLGQWAGVRPKVKNKGGAIVAPCPFLTNAVVATGHGTNGILMSPHTAYQVEALLNAMPLPTS